ncbi:hypothetical protein J4211_05390 [Candidatus Woesearchaeota archaeon]|nr:hypothetical protein [Candidatus Woesearchaeota archaeon]
MNTEDRVAWLQKVEWQIQERKEYEHLAADAKASLAIEGKYKLKKMITLTSSIP